MLKHRLINNMRDHNSLVPAIPNQNSPTLHRLIDSWLSKPMCTLGFSPGNTLDALEHYVGT